MESQGENIRLQLFLARCGVASRRKAGELIEQGKVKVNGEIVRQPFRKVDPAKDTVEFNQKTLSLTKHRFYKIYKPVGYLSTMSDDQGRRTVAELIPAKYGRLFYVGRLDLDSEGLMILTNHGEAANRMLHPRFHFPKTYNVVLKSPPRREDLVIMSKGIELDGKKTIPAIYELNGQEGSKRVRVEIVEGRKRQIKKVFKEFGYRVVELKRVSIGPIKLGNMQSGEIREFTMEELLSLLSALDLYTF